MSHPTNVNATGPPPSPPIQATEQNQSDVPNIEDNKADMRQRISGSILTSNFRKAVQTLTQRDVQDITPPKNTFHNLLPPGPPAGDENRYIQDMFTSFSELWARVVMANNARSYNAITVWVLQELLRIMREQDPTLADHFDELYESFMDMWDDEGPGSPLEVTPENCGRPQGFLDFVNGQAPARIISTKYNSADLQPIPELIQAARPDPAGAIA